jgi:hypothetical protein
MGELNMAAAMRGESTGATEEEITEVILSTLRQLAIMSVSIPMPPERREKIEEAVTVLEGCAGIYKNRRGEKFIWRDPANSR